MEEKAYSRRRMGDRRWDAAGRALPYANALARPSHGLRWWSLLRGVHGPREVRQCRSTSRRKSQADVIMVGTPGRTPLVVLVLGSMTQRLLHIAPCPVLAVPSRGGVQVTDP